jgi:hypothetical protein
MNFPWPIRRADLVLSGLDLMSTGVDQSALLGARLGIGCRRIHFPGAEN